jgi:tartrate/fumarate subfamily iron-sulfur-dependent hydro-lyase alpha chain
MDKNSRKTKNVVTETMVHDLALELLRTAAVVLPPQYVSVMEEAYQRERNGLARINLKSILDAVRVAEEEGRPICQDTGLLFFHVVIGGKVRIEGDLHRALCQATERGTREIPLRPNAVHPLSRKNLGTNCGWGVPYVYYDFAPEADYLEVSAIPKGGGGALQTAFVDIPRIGPKVKPMMKGILKAIANAKIACPPLVVGVCLGGNKDLTAQTATMAVFRRPTRSPNPDPEAQAFEREILETANRLNMGPVALGGDTSVLAVHLEFRACHTAAIPCAVAFSCWPLRIATARIYPDGRVDQLTHPKKQAISK